MKKILLNFLRFVKEPTDYRFKGLASKTKWSIFFTLLFAEICITLSLVIPLSQLINTYILTLRGEPINYSHDSLAFSIFVIALFVPILEELIFRLPLKYRSWYRFLLPKSFWNKHFKSLLYFSTLIFALLHSINYKNDTALFYTLAPLLVISQLMGGFIMAYLRVRISFPTGILYHMTWNFIFVAIAPFLYYLVLGHTTLKEEEKTHRIHVEEYMYHKKEEQTFRIDSSNQKIKTIEIKQYALQHALDSLFGAKYHVEDVIINLKFNSKTAEHGEKEFIEVLRKEYKIEELCK